MRIQIHLPKEHSEILLQAYGSIENLPGQEIVLHGTKAIITEVCKCDGIEGALDIQMNVSNHLMPLFQMRHLFSETGHFGG